ncbi:MAG: putative toxin-antitoxin system toxin component, PIN family, partial [Gammaproteobacteria bacterium]
NVYDFKPADMAGAPVDLARYRGQVLLIVNTASQCGFTPQYQGLEALYRQFKLDSARQEEVFNLYRARTLVVAPPDGFSLQNLMLPSGFPRCRDRDDQHFLALAHHAKADALVSKDKDLLKLKRRAGKFGVKVLSVPQLAEMADSVDN